MTNTMNAPQAAAGEQNDVTECGAQPLESQTRIEIFTDGSCLGNPGLGGYGIVILRKDGSGKIIKSLERSGHVTAQTTNNRMEMTAACVGLESLGRATAEPVTLICDASLIPNAMSGWLVKWKAKDWRKSDGKPVENRNLWERLERAAEGRNVTFAWVRGHNGAEHNERADKLARAASRRAEKIVMGR